MVALIHAFLKLIDVQYVAMSKLAQLGLAMSPEFLINDYFQKSCMESVWWKSYDGQKDILKAAVNLDSLNLG